MIMEGIAHLIPFIVLAVQLGKLPQEVLLLEGGVASGVVAATRLSSGLRCCCLEGTLPLAVMHELGLSGLAEFVCLECAALLISSPLIGLHNPGQALCLDSTPDGVSLEVSEGHILLDTQLVKEILSPFSASDVGFAIGPVDGAMAKAQ
jgi:hypothetical protein